MAYTQGPPGGLGRARKDWDPFANIPEDDTSSLRGLRPVYAEQFPTGGGYMEAVSPPGSSGLERGYQEYAREKGLQAKPRAEYARAYGQALEEIRGPEPMALPEVSTDPMANWQQGRKQYLHVLNKAREMGATPEETAAELKHWGVDKIDLYTPPKPQFMYEGVPVTPEQKAALMKATSEEKVPVILPNGQTVNVKPGEALKYATSEENRKARQAHFNDTMAFKKQVSDKMMELKSRLEPALLQDVIKKEDSVSQYENLIDSYDEKFAGKVAFGPTGTAIYERIGGEPERVAWWKRFNTQDAALRHDLFGATMTDNEKAAWDSITINENTDSDIAANELAVRHKIVVDNLARNLDKYEATGRSVSGLREPAATGGAGKVRRYNPATGGFD